MHYLPNSKTFFTHTQVQVLTFLNKSTISIYTCPNTILEKRPITIFRPFSLFYQNDAQMYLHFLVVFPCIHFLHKLDTCSNSTSCSHIHQFQHPLIQLWHSIPIRFDGYPALTSKFHIFLHSHNNIYSVYDIVLLKII